MAGEHMDFKSELEQAIYANLYALSYFLPEERTENASRAHVRAMEGLEAFRRARYIMGGLDDVESAEGPTGAHEEVTLPTLHLKPVPGEYRAFDKSREGETPEWEVWAMWDEDRPDRTALSVTLEGELIARVDVLSPCESHTAGPQELLHEAQQIACGLLWSALRAWHLQTWREVRWNVPGLHPHKETETAIFSYEEEWEGGILAYEPRRRVKLEIFREDPQAPGETHNSEEEQAREVWRDILHDAFTSDNSILDEMVHEAASKIARGVNNEGFEAQLSYLLEDGMTLGEILTELGLEET